MNTESTQHTSSSSNTITGFPFLQLNQYATEKFIANLNTRIQTTLYNHIVDNAAAFGTANVQEFVRLLLQEFFAGELVSKSSFTALETNEETQKLKHQIDELNILVEKQKKRISGYEQFIIDQETTLKQTEITLKQTETKLQQTETTLKQTETKLKQAETTHQILQETKIIVSESEDIPNYLMPYVSFQENNAETPQKQDETEWQESETPQKQAETDTLFHSATHIVEQTDSTKEVADLKAKLINVEARFKQALLDLNILYAENEEHSNRVENIQARLEEALKINEANKIPEGYAIYSKESFAKFELKFKKAIELEKENIILKGEIERLLTELGSVLKFDDSHTAAALKKMAVDIAKASRSMFYSIDEKSIIELFLKYYKIETLNAKVSIAQ
jgi:hypothetical protein